MTILPLILGLTIFFAVHRIPTAPAFRTSLIERFGEGPYKGLFSLVALVGFVLLIWGYGQARLNPAVIFTPPDWGRYVTWVLMVPAFILFAAYGLPGRIAAAVKHPQITGVKIWAFAHLFANGMLHDLLLFIGFLGWAVFDRISLKNRGAPEATAGTNAIRNDIIAIVAGLTLYAVFIIWLHPILIGVPAVY